jgi:branched-chain amino acid transport system substrate-binding protein
MTLRTRACFAAALWTLACVAPWAVPAHAGDADVAVLLDLTGTQSTLGGAAMNGFILALRQASPQGSPLAYSALIDTQSDPAAAAAAANAVLERADVVAGFTDNDAALTAGPVFQEAGIPFLSIGATNPSLPKSVGDRVFLTPFGDNAQGAAAAEFGQRRFGDTVAILWDSTSSYTRDLPRYFRTRFEEIDGATLYDTPFKGGCDLGEQGAEIAALEPAPAFVFLSGRPECIGETIASLRKAGVDQPILGGDSFDTPNLTAGRERIVDDVWFTTHAWLSPRSTSQATRAFIRDYEGAYGSPPDDAFAALGYDAARLLLDALGRTKSASPDAIARALEATRDFKGVTGILSFGEDAHVPEKTVWILRVAQNERDLADAFIPAKVPAAVYDP